MKKKIIFNCFLWFPLFVSILCTAQTQRMCGSAGRLKRVPKMQTAQKTEAINAIPDSYHFMVKHHIFRTSTKQAIQQSDIAKIMIDLNARFDNTNIQFHDCGSPEIITVAKEEDGIVITQGSDANLVGIDNTHRLQGTINVYWPFELYQSYSPAEPSLSIELEGVHVENHNVFISSKFSVDRMIITLTHELGHYFGLVHTFGDYQIGDGPDANHKGTNELVTRDSLEGNCDYAGDGLCDTPADPNYYNGCGLSGKKTDSKGKLYVPDAGNYMSYSPYTCQSHFSYKQSERMLSFAKDYVFELTQYRKEISTTINNLTKTYSASAIIANNTISGTSNVNYKAQAEIKLDPGFKALKGVVFNARIEYDCNNLGLPRPAVADDEVVSGINEQPAGDSHFNVYPNPFNDVFNVSFSLATDAQTTISVQNILGQETLKLADGALKKGDHKNQFDLSGLPNGIYFLVLKNDSAIQTKKIIKK